MGVKNNRGFIDWVVQRVSALIIAAYLIFLLVFFTQHCPLQFSDWQGLFACQWMRYVTVLVVLAVVWHAWIGLWTVFTDYVKCGVVRLILEIAVILVLTGFVIWCLDIMWR